MTARATSSGSLSRRWEPLRANLIRWARSTRAADPGPLRTAWAATLRHFRRRGYLYPPCRGRLAVRGRSRTCRGREVPGTTRAALSRAFPVLPRAKPRSSSAPTAAATSCPVGSPHHSRTLCPCISPYPSTERETKLMLRRRDSPAGSRSNHGSWRRDTWPGPLRSGLRIRALLDGRTSRLGCPRRS